MANDPDYEPTDPVEAAARFWKTFAKWVVDTKNSAAVTAVATLAICITGTIYTVYSALQWSANKEAADAARNAAETAATQLELSERPWIAVSNPVVISPLIVSIDGTVHTTVHVVAENVSNNVATSASIHLSLGPGSGEEDVALVRSLCSEANPTDPQDFFASPGTVLFPKGVLNPEFSYDVSNSRMSKERPVLNPPLGPAEYLLPRAIDGCVQYHSAIGKTTYYTGFIYINLPKTEIGRVKFDSTSGEAITEPLSVFSGKNGKLAIPSSWVHLVPYPYSGTVPIK